MEIIYFTVIAVALYFVADWLLGLIESRLGRVLEHRSLVFFAILLGLALASFAVIRQFAG